MLALSYLLSVVMRCMLVGEVLHMAQLMPLPLTVSCFSKIQIGFAFLVPAYLGSPGKGPLNVCNVVVCYLLELTWISCCRAVEKVRCVAANVRSGAAVY